MVLVLKFIPSVMRLTDTSWWKTDWVFFPLRFLFALFLTIKERVRYFSFMKRANLINKTNFWNSIKRKQLSTKIVYFYLVLLGLLYSAEDMIINLKMRKRKCLKFKSVQDRFPCIKKRLCQKVSKQVEATSLTIQHLKIRQN